MKSTRLATLCAALGLASFLTLNSQAQITVDGTRDSGYGSALAVQQIGGWGTNNTLANIFAKQEGGKLKLFIGGRTDFNAFVLFLDTKSGGYNAITSNTLPSSGVDNWQINNLGSNNTVGMTFESGFTADYVIRIYGEGSAAHVNSGDLQGQTYGYSGNAGAAAISSGFITEAKANWQNVTVANADVSNGIEFSLDLTSLGVVGAADVKFMALMINGGSTWGSGNVLASLPAGSSDLGAGIKTANFETIAGIQTITLAVDNSDLDGDGFSDATDPDDDGDGLDDTVETNTGVFVNAANTGSNPRNADTDADGVNDGAEVTAGTNPNKPNYATMAAPGNYVSFVSSNNPTGNWQADGTNNTGMTKVGEFGWTLTRNMTNRGSFMLKFVANGSFATQWGSSSTNGVALAGGDVINFAILATGLHTFTFNNDTLAYTIARAGTNGLTYNQWAAQYGLAADSEAADADSDFLTNGEEFAANTDPNSNDTDGDTLWDVEEVDGDFTDPGIGSQIALGVVTTDPLSLDTDGDGLNDFFEVSNSLDPTDNGSKSPYANFNNLPGLAANPNGAGSDPDGDGLTNLQEQTAGSNPLAAGTGFVKVSTSIHLAGAFTTPSWTENPATKVLDLVPVANFTWRGILYWSDTNAPADKSFKFLSDRSWGKQWGTNNSTAAGFAVRKDKQAGGVTSDPGPLVATAISGKGYYVFELNEFSGAYLVAAVGTADQDGDQISDDWEAFYGAQLPTPTSDLDPSADSNGNGVSNLAEYQNGGNPVLDVTVPTLNLASGVAKLSWVAKDTAVTLAASDVTATDDVTTTPTVTFSPSTVSTATDGLTTVTYTATDAAGNASTITRVIAVGDVAPGWRKLHYPRTATINTLSSVDVYGRIFIAGATPGIGQAPNVIAEVGVNSTDTDPSGWPAGAWKTSAHNAGFTDGDDEYRATVNGSDLSVGTHYFAFRFKIGDGIWHYAGINASGTDGGPWDGTSNGNGVLTVQAARQVTYAVDMGVQIFKGAFDPATNGVELRADFNGFGGGASVLTREGTSTVYSGTFAVGGAEGSTNKFKFFSTGTNAVGFEAGADREAVLTANAVTLNTGTNFFSGISESRKITFRVDMSVQAAKGNFNTNTGVVQIAGSFNGWSTTATPLSAQGNGVYAAEVTVDGPLSGISYKFLKGTTADDYEVVSDRTISAVLPNLQASTLDVVLFGNDDGVAPTDIALSASSIAENNAVNAVVGALSSTDATAGDTHTYSLVAGLGDGDNGSFNISGADLRAGAAFDFETKASYSIRVRSTDVAGNFFEKAFTVSVSDVNETPSGSTFAGWSGGATLDATNVGKYAIGGASSPTATDGVKPTSTVSGGNLVLTAIVRVDDPKLTVVGEAVGSLTDYGTPASITSVTGSAAGIDQTGVPAGCEKQAFTVPQGADARKFLRLKATLAP